MEAMREAPKAILFIGLQASGKSTFYQRKMSEYIHINLDTLHTRNKEKQLLEECLRNGNSFVVDNTNPTAAEREKYIHAAKAHGFFVEGYYFQSILADCILRNRNREGKACVPDKAIAGTSNRLELPDLEEGFDRLYFVRMERDGFAVEPWRHNGAI
jgi:predicted kinase